MPQTLLLADDSVTIQRVIELTFADEDIDVVAVGDGDQAIARINSDPPDIVLVDVGMPGRSGYEVAQHVKRAPGLDHIPVLLLTGAFEPVDQDKMAEAGCDGVLAKPFEPQQVIARVKELLSRPSQERRPPPRAETTRLETTRPETTWPETTWPETTRPETTHTRADRTPASEVARLDSYFAQLDAAFATLSENRTDEPRPGGDARGNDAGTTSLLSIDWFSATPSVPSHDAPAAGTSTPAAAPHVEPSDAFDLDMVSGADTREDQVERARSAWDAPPPGMERRADAVDSTAPGNVEPPSIVSHVEPPRSLDDAFAAILAKRHEPAPAARQEPSSAPQQERPSDAPRDLHPAASHGLGPGVQQGPEEIEQQQPPVPPQPSMAPAATESASPAPVAQAPAAAVPEEALQEITRRVLERLSDRIVRETVTGLVSEIAERLVREEIEKIKAAIK